jgi:Cu/Ag efflux pump CusA
MVGGMVTTTLLTLIVIPVIYFIWERKQLNNPKEVLSAQ